MRQPLVRRAAGLLPELSGESSGRHLRFCRQIFDTQFPGKIRLQPLEDWRQPGCSCFLHGLRHKLGLSTVAMRRHYQPACNSIGNVGPIVEPHNMQAKIDPRSAARGSQDPAFIDVQDIWFNLNGRVL